MSKMIKTYEWVRLKENSIFQDRVFKVMMKSADGNKIMIDTTLQGCSSTALVHTAMVKEFISDEKQKEQHEELVYVNAGFPQDLFNRFED